MSTARIERRLAAILALDVAGYSQLMGADELGTLNALKSHRRDRIDPAIARHNGRIVTIAGDGLMVEFASVVDAVAAAVAIQRAMLTFNAVIADERRIVLRIGINVGDIIIDGGDIFGDGVNVAARLEALCEPGGVCISRSANEQVRDRLPLPFTDRGEQSVKNIARAIGVFGLSAREIAAMPENALPLPVAPPRRPSPWRAPPLALRLAFVAVLLVAAAAAGWWFGMPTPAPQAAPAPRPPAPVAQDRRGSITVLPFDASTQAGTRLARDIAERLASDRGWPVTAPYVAARYLGKTQDPRAIGREQNVHFTLSGTAREQDARLHVTVTLKETQEGRDIWSQQFDTDPASLVAAVAAEVNQAMIDAEAARARRERATALDATDYYFAALETALIPLTRTNLMARVALLNQALALDPANPPALALAARLRALLVLNEWSTDRTADLAFAAKAADRLLEAAPRDIYQLRTKAYVLRAQGNLDQAIALHRRVLEINPAIADSHREIGVILQAQNRHAEALASFRAARRLSDADFILDTQTASALLANGLFGEAITLARTALAESPGGGLDTPWLTLIAAYAATGDTDPKAADIARAELARYFTTAQPIRTLAELRKDPSLAALPNLVPGLRRAGLPDE
jgi:class 3 adenylate cyclase/TolB-like protein